MGKRHQGREIALQILYEIDTSHKTLAEILAEKLNLRFPIDATNLNVQKLNLTEHQQIIDFALTIVKGVIENREKLDPNIEKNATNWKISRMAVVDRNILRIASYEMNFCPDVPLSVSINEAVDLGKEYGSEDSSSFINGILDHIATDIRESSGFKNIS